MATTSLPAAISIGRRIELSCGKAYSQTLRLAISAGPWRATGSAQIGTGGVVTSSPRRTTVDAACGSSEGYAVAIGPGFPGGTAGHRHCCQRRCKNPHSAG